VIDERPEWMADGACNGTDPSLFFPERGESLAAPRSFCARCPVRETCLDYALDHRILHGVWGKTSERQRRELRKQRNADLTCKACGATFTTTRALGSHTAGHRRRGDAA
jgi:WhiB family transcriptional regulator, redox-sensing transcriptional regulator